MTKIRTIEALSTTIKDYDARIENIDALVHANPAVNKTTGWQSAKNVRLYGELRRARQDMAEMAELIELAKLLKLVGEMDFGFLEKHDSLLAVSEDTIENIGVYAKLASLCKAWDSNSNEDMITLGKYANQRDADEEARDAMHR